MIPNFNLLSGRTTKGHRTKRICESYGTAIPYINSGRKTNLCRSCCGNKFIIENQLLKRRSK